MTLERMTVLPDEASYSYGSDNSVISNALSGGMSRSRIDQINSAAIISCSWTVNPSEYQYIRAFFNFYTSRGVKPFLIELILDQPYLEVYEAKFVANSMVTEDNEGLSYTIEAELEVVPKYDPIHDELILIIYEQGGMDYINLFERFVNYDLEI